MNLPEIKEGDFVNTASSGWGVVTKHNDKLIIVYWSGGYDCVSQVTLSENELNFPQKIVRGAHSFYAARDGNGRVIYDRNAKPVEMTISQIEEKLGINNLKIIKEDKE